MKIRLQIDAAGRTTPFVFAGPVVRIGRDAECELRLDGPAGDAVSRQHARIELSEEGATVADTGSSNGTLLNDERVQGPTALRVGDRIQMGHTGAVLTVLALDLTAAPQRRNAAVNCDPIPQCAAAMPVATAVESAVEAPQGPPPSERFGMDPPPSLASDHPPPSAELQWTNPPAVRQAVDEREESAHAENPPLRRHRPSWLGIVVGIVILVLGHGAIVLWLWPWLMRRGGP
jgi:hypothetical protein